MLKLTNAANGKPIASHVEVAESFVARAVGLLGRASLPEGRALWIKQCRSIHTWFMRFAIDLIFVDADLKVVKVYENVGPWRMTLPAWGAKSVFELPAGTLKASPVARGDRLHVGD